MRKVILTLIVICASFVALAQAPLEPPLPQGTTYYKGRIVSQMGLGIIGCSNLDLAYADGSGCFPITTLPSASTINASVNSQINVMAPPYNAKGDCSTNDHDAILAAETAAFLSPLPVPLYFPAPPGNCYLTSTLPWSGLSMIGQPPLGIGSTLGSAGVVIKGMPGEDIFHAPDPTIAGGIVPRTSWAIRDIAFMVDDSVDASASFPHRWPGRWVQDAAMSLGSAVIRSTNAGFTCGDKGQAIKVKGAGVTGADLVTTIATVTPCGVASPIVTLAATASTAVSGATAYISVAGLPVTQTVGNAALAFDCKDGNSADYVLSSTPENAEDELTNVKFATTTSFGNNSGSLFIQGCYGPYALDATNVVVQFPDFGPVFTNAEVNPTGTRAYGLRDYLNWHGGYLGSTIPWISYGGSFATLVGAQVWHTSAYGPQILGGAYSWTISFPEIEAGAANPVGVRLEGGSHLVTNSQLGGEPGGSLGPIWDASDSTCINCSPYGIFQVNGVRNQIDIANGLAQTVVDNGIGNSIVNRGYNPSNSATSASRRGVQIPFILDQPVGVQTADFIAGGNVAAPYRNNLDLLFGPDDFLEYGAPTDQESVSVDATALFGKTFAVTAATHYFLSFYSMMTQSSTGLAMIGTEVPATKAIVYFGVKCATSTSLSLTVYEDSTSIATASPSCSSSYTIAAVTTDFTTYSGHSFGFGLTSPSNDAMLEYVAVRPYQHDYNGQQPVLSTQSTTLTPWSTPTVITSICHDATGKITDASCPANGIGGATQKNCLSVACAGGSTYASGVTYTNSSTVPVMEEVTMTASNSVCTGTDFRLVAVIGGENGPSNGITNDCNGVASVTFMVPVGATFSATASQFSGGAESFSITSWLEVSM